MSVITCNFLITRVHCKGVLIDQQDLLAGMTTALSSLLLVAIIDSQ
jgi:hypothetical protein